MLLTGALIFFALCFLALLFLFYSLNCILMGLLHLLKRDAADDLHLISTAYLALLRSGSFRVRVQPELCALRDYIAEMTGQEPEQVQNEYEARASGIDRRN